MSIWSSDFGVSGDQTNSQNSVAWGFWTELSSVFPGSLTAQDEESCCWGHIKAILSKCWAEEVRLLTGWSLAGVVFVSAEYLQKWDLLVPATGP